MSETKTERSAKDMNETHHQPGQQQQQPPVWFCPSRWLLAHHDLAADINTMSSHMCLADTNNDGECLLALIDFKRSKQVASGGATTSESSTKAMAQMPAPARAPYECRMRVYRGQQLIYNHFLEDLPACLIVTSVRVPKQSSRPSARQQPKKSPTQWSTQGFEHQPLLTMPINDDVYFYHKLRASHKLSLEDTSSILDSLNRSEVDAWEMVKQNKVEPETMRELLASLSQELGNHELTSHSQNFLALETSEQRRQYLVSWRMKKLASGGSSESLANYGEQLISMDTICCAAARLRYNSPVSCSGDFGESRDKFEPASFSPLEPCDSNSAFERDGLVLGTEDRHLLIYELRAIRNRLECHYRLPATPDHILVERCSPRSTSSEPLTYKILVSCRDCRIYSLDQRAHETSDKLKRNCEPRQLIALKSNVLEMSWTGLLEPDVGWQQLRPGGEIGPKSSPSGPCFVVACLDRRLYCFGSQSGTCKWIIELELPVTCLTCLPKLQLGQRQETSLVGVASQANRVDFYDAATGRIADSIYFNQDEWPQAMTFGRFGREDNCLCLVTNSGRLLVLILKRGAKFAHGQCLSSAASYAASSLATCRQLLRGSDDEPEALQTTGGADSSGGAKQAAKLDQRAGLPSGFELSKTNRSSTDRMIDSIIQSNHNCDQTSLKGALDAHSQGPRLQIPVKGRDFVDQILEQSRESSQTSRVFASHMVKLRDKIRSSLEQRAALLNGADSSSASMADGHHEGNRLVLTQVVGLGNVYRIRLALRANLEKFIDRYHELLPLDARTDQWTLNCLLRPRKCDLSKRQCLIRPFRQVIEPERDEKAKYLVRATCEANIEAKLTILGPLMEPIEGDVVPLGVQIYVRHQSSTSNQTSIQSPILLTSISVNLMTG